MDFNQQTWDSLRSKRYEIGDFYVQSGVGPQGGRMYVVVNGVAMPFDDARALDRGVVTLDEIAQPGRTVRTARRAAGSSDGLDQAIVQ